MLTHEIYCKDCTHEPICANKDVYANLYRKVNELDCPANKKNGFELNPPTCKYYHKETIYRDPLRGEM